MAVKHRKPLKKRVKAGTSKAATAARKVKFRAEYLKNGGNATRAAIAAGYAPNSAGRHADRLVKDGELMAALAKDAETVAERAGLTVERTLIEVRRLAYSDPRKLFDERGELRPIHQLDDDTAATVASIEQLEEFGPGAPGARELTGYTKKLKVWDKNAALEKAMKFHGLYKADNEQTPVGGANIYVVGVQPAKR